VELFPKKEERTSSRTPKVLCMAENQSLELLMKQFCMQVIMLSEEEKKKREPIDACDKSKSMLLQESMT